MCAVPVISSATPTNGPYYGLNRVTIAGSNLGSGSDITAVRFGLVSAIVVSQSQTQLVVVAPLGGSLTPLTAASVTITVSSVSYGTATSAFNLYRYNPLRLFYCSLNNRHIA